MRFQKLIMWIIVASVIQIHYGHAQNNDSTRDQSDQADADRMVKECIDEHDGLNRDMADCIGVYADDCLEQERKFTTSNMRQCVNREFQVWDELLNRDYQTLMESLTSDEHKSKLREAQRHWIKFSKSFCRLPVEINGGTLSFISADRCMMELTARQDIELRLLNSSPEGN